MKRKNLTSKVGGNMKTKKIFDEGDESKEQTGNFPASTFVKGEPYNYKGKSFVNNYASRKGNLTIPNSMGPKSDAGKIPYSRPARRK